MRHGLFAALLIGVALLGGCSEGVLDPKGPIAATWGVLFIAIAFRLSRMREGDAPVAQRLFVFSIAYLFLLFAALLAGHVGGRPQASLQSAGAHVGVATAGEG